MVGFIEIYGRHIGLGYPVFVIAEIGVNHNGSPELAKKLVDAAIDAGADAVKFQTFKAEDICTDTAEKAEYQTKNIGKRVSQQEMLKRLELSYEDHAALKKYCDKKGIIFFSTPHSNVRDVDLLEQLGVPLYKIGSGDLTNLPFLDYIARKGKPMIVSTGMATEEEILEAYGVITKTGNIQVIFLKCTTNYPCPEEYANVKGVLSLAQRLPVQVGYSDHTQGYAASALAVSLGATVIEKHFTLDQSLEGPDHKASLEPKELKEFISVLREIENAKLPPEEVFTHVRENLNINLGTDHHLVLGHGELMPYSFEKDIAQVARKSIVAATELPVGTVLQEHHLTVKRPGIGVPPKYMFGPYNKILGKRIRTSLRKDQLLSFEKLEENYIGKRKILYVSGTRADYGLMKFTLQKIKDHPALDLEILSTGMHLMPPFGRTIKLLQKDGFKVHEVEATYADDSKEAMSLFLGSFIQKATLLISTLKPDLLLVLGDRSEMLGAAMIGSYLSIPVVHLHGGEISSTVDEHVRHAITKLAHVHLPATAKSAERIYNLGEEQWRIHMVGAPGLDSIIHQPCLTAEEVQKVVSIDLSKPTALVVFHPVSMEITEAAAQMNAILGAVLETGLQAIVIYPNADAGGGSIIEVLERYKNNPLFSIHQNLPHEYFTSLMKYVQVMMGNSSSGIIEAASFKLPVVNVGSRQEGRERAENVLDVLAQKKEIKMAIEKALSLSFRASLQNCINPYGDGMSAERIVKILFNIEIDKNLLQKKMRY